MGFQFVVMFIDSFMDDVTYVSDVIVCMYRMIDLKIRFHILISHILM